MKDDPKLKPSEYTIQFIFTEYRNALLQSIDACERRMKAEHYRLNELIGRLRYLDGYPKQLKDSEFHKGHHSQQLIDELKCDIKWHKTPKERKRYEF